MALFNTKPEPVKQSVTHGDDIASKIQQRRYQILVHSLIYYELDTNLVSDNQWAAWATELAELQRQYPDVADKVIFAEAFKEFDGSTGFDLPYRDEQIINIAHRLLLLSKSSDMRVAADGLCRVQPTPAHYKGFYDKYPQKTTKQTSYRKAVKKVEPAKRKKLF